MSVPGEVDSLGWWSLPPGVYARGSGLTGLVVPSTWCLCQGKWTHWAGGPFHLVSVPGEVDSLSWWSLPPGVYARGSGLTGLVVPSTWCLCQGKWTHWAGGPFNLVSMPGEVDSLSWWSLPPGVYARGSGLSGLVIPSTWCLCQGKWTHWAGDPFHLVSMPGEVDSLGWWSHPPGVCARGSGLTGLVVLSTWCLCQGKWTHWAGGPFNLVSMPGEVDSLSWWSLPPGVYARGSGLSGLVIPSTWCLCQGKWTHWAGDPFHLVSMPGEVDSLGWWSHPPGVCARGSGLTGLVIPSTWCLGRGKWTH